MSKFISSIVVTVLMATFSSSGQTAASQLKEDFIKDMQKTCLDNLHTDPQTKYVMTEVHLVEYCSCVAETLAETPDFYEKPDKASEVTKIHKARNFCEQALQKKWSSSN